MALLVNRTFSKLEGFWFLVLHQKRTKNRYTAVFSDTLRIETTKLVASSRCTECKKNSKHFFWYK